MKLYLILLEIDIEKDYKRLINAIEAFERHTYVANSTWIVSSSLSAKDLRNYLQEYLDGRDNIFVSEINSNAAWRLDRKKGDWLIENSLLEGLTTRMSA